MGNGTDKTSNLIMGLNEYHLRKISVFLFEVEKSINLIEIYLTNPPKGRMFKVENDLSAKEKETLQNCITQIRECICEFADALKLTARTENLEGIINGDFAIHWADVFDIEPKGLNSYGEVGEEAIEPLKYFTDKLKNLLMFSAEEY